METMPTLIMQDALAQPELLSLVMDEQVHVTELLPGWAWEATLARNQSPVVYVCGEKTRSFNDTLYDQRLDYFLFDLLRKSPLDVDRLTVRGVYSDDTGQVRLYDLEINGEVVGPLHAFTVFQSWGVLAVPVLSLPGQTLYQWLNRRPPEHAAMGASRLGDRLRLGVVIRPVNERIHPDFGRFILKMECPQCAP